MIEAAVGDLEPGARIVDLGCGPGQVAAYLATRGRSAVGLDLTEAMLAIAHQRHPTLPAVCGDLLALPFRSNGLDGVVAWYSLHNFPRRCSRPRCQSSTPRCGPEEYWSSAPTPESARRSSSTSGWG